MKITIEVTKEELSGNGFIDNEHLEDFVIEALEERGDLPGFNVYIKVVADEVV